MLGFQVVLLTYMDVQGADSAHLAGFFVPEDGGYRAAGDFTAKRCTAPNTNDFVTWSDEE